MNLPLHYQSIASISRRIRDRQLSPVELTRHMLGRIEAIEPRTLAYAHVMAEEALARAGQAEAEIARGLDRGPLHGVPLAVKDLFFTKGHATTAGMPAYGDCIPDFDATVVERLYAAGAVLLGKHKMSEAAFSTHHPSVTPPLNPWNPLYSTGSSSSGSAVATAAGLCFGSLASDTGGSIRFPSACNNLSGIKPTRGRVSVHGTHAFCPSLDHVGPLARSVEDAAFLLQAIAGHDPADPTSSTMAVPDYADGPPDLSAVRIGWDENLLAILDGEVADALQEAVGVLRALGAGLVPCRLPDFRAMAQRWILFCASETALVHERAYARAPALFGPEIAGLIELQKRISSAELARAWLERLAFTEEMDGLLRSVDMLVLPTLTMAPPTVRDLEETEDQDELIVRIIRLNAPIDISGHPSVVMPCGRTAAGLPLSFQLVGPRMSEKALIGAGRAFQRRTAWHLDHPELP